MPLSDVRRLAARYQKLKQAREELDAAIRQAREEGESYKAIAQAAGMSPMTIFNTINGRRYR